MPLFNALNHQAPYWSEQSVGTMFFCGAHRKKFQTMFRSLWKNHDFMESSLFVPRVERNVLQVYEAKLQGAMAKADFPSTYMIRTFFNSEERFLHRGSNLGYRFLSTRMRESILQSLGNEMQMLFGDRIPSRESLEKAEAASKVRMLRLAEKLVSKYSK